MATSPTAPSSSPSPAVTRGPLRLRLHTSQRVGAADGVWWPRSRDLQAEAADLVDHFPEEAGHIDRLLFSRPDWDDVVTAGRGVRHIHAARGRVKVGSFPSDDTRLMVLSLSTGRRLKLVVLPPDTDPAEAERRLATPVRAHPSPSAADLERWDDDSPRAP